MTSAQFKLDKFVGPLDVLLHLITKHQLNIYDIEITSLLEQYMEYIDGLECEDLDYAADFLEMAARLIYIKTCSLLPQDEEAAEMKKELEGRLIEYSLCKLAAQELKNLYVGGEIFVRSPAKVPVDKTYRREHDPQVLYDAYMGLSEKTRREKPLNAQIFEPLVSHKVVSLISKVVYVLKKLHLDGECDLSHIYDGMESKSERVATFLAILELTKSGRICLNDDNTVISFNEDSRKKKNTSDDELDDIELTSEKNEDISAFENISDDVDDEDDDIPEFLAEDDIQTKPEYKSFNDYKPKPVNKPETPVATEKIAVECAAVITSSKLEQKYIPMIVEEISNNSDEISENELSEEVENIGETVEILGELSDVTTVDEIEEEIAAVETSVQEIPAEVQTEEVTKETNEQSENTLIDVKKVITAELSEPVTVNTVQIAETQEDKPIISEEKQDTYKKTDEPIPIPQGILELMNLPQEEQISVFKPNYWGRLGYYWGISGVGDDSSRNFWKYGKYRK